MSKPISIGDLLTERMESIIRGEKVPPIEEVPGLEAEIARRADERDAAARQWAADRIASELAERRRLIALEMRGEGKFPAKLVNAAIAPWPTETTAMQHARAYLQGRARYVIVLAGGVGTGKSTAAAAIAFDGGGSRPGFIRASALERRGRYSKDLDAWLESRTMLVIDDLGAEVLDGHGVFRSLLDETIDMFYSDEKRIVITTNLIARRDKDDGAPQFVERYGDRVASRLAECGTWASCGSRDLRRDQLRLVPEDRS